MKISPSSTVGIIGGEGKTGRQFARLFAAQGCRVIVTGRRTKQKNADLMRTCDVVLFSVPLVDAAAIIRREAAKARRKDQLLLDVSSLKVRETDALLSGAGEVIGMHPLFGPTTDHRKELVILCPARASKETIASLRAFLKRMQIRTEIMTPKKHDELMAVVQVIPHLKSFLMAEVLRSLDVDFRHILKNCTPTYELEFNVIGRFLDDDPSLYMPIIFRNPETKRILRIMRRTVDAYSSTARKKSLRSAMNGYRRAKEFFAPFTHRARAHSEACIRTLTSLTR
jgi:prephenate dehydrogenase